MRMEHKLSRASFENSHPNDAARHDTEGRLETGKNEKKIPLLPLNLIKTPNTLVSFDLKYNFESLIGSKFDL